MAAFDEGKRSCRVGLEKHNARQRVLRAWTSVDGGGSGLNDASKSSSLSDDTVQLFTAIVTGPESSMDAGSESEDWMLPMNPLLHKVEAAITEPPLLSLPVLFPEFEGRTIDELILAFGLDEEASPEGMGHNDELDCS